MKFNWGTAIILAIAAFITFIMYFVVSMGTDKKMEHDLVTEEYYKKEIDFQNQLDKETNSQKLAENLRLEKTSEGLMLHFPKDLDLTKIDGQVFLYRPSNKQLDNRIPLSLSSHQMLIPDKHFVDGRWNIEVDWSYGDESYFFKEDIIY